MSSSPRSWFVERVETLVRVACLLLGDKVRQTTTILNSEGPTIGNFSEKHDAWDYCKQDD